MCFLVSLLDCIPIPTSLPAISTTTNLQPQPNAETKPNQLVAQSTTNQQPPKAANTKSDAEGNPAGCCCA